MKYNQINNCDCMGFIAAMPDKSVDFTFTDIPYNLMDRSGNGLRRLDKGNANILTFKLDTFLRQGTIQPGLFLFFHAERHSMGSCMRKNQSISHEWPAYLFKRHRTCRIV